MAAASVEPLHLRAASAAAVLVTEEDAAVAAVSQLCAYTPTPRLLSESLTAAAGSVRVIGGRRAAAGRVILSGDRRSGRCGPRLRRPSVRRTGHLSGHLRVIPPRAPAPCRAARPS